MTGFLQWAALTCMLQGFCHVTPITDQAWLVQVDYAGNYDIGIAGIDRAEMNEVITEDESGFKLTVRIGEVKSL